MTMKGLERSNLCVDSFKGDDTEIFEVKMNLFKLIPNTTLLRKKSNKSSSPI